MQERGRENCFYDYTTFTQRNLFLCIRIIFVTTICEQQTGFATAVKKR